MKRKRSIGAAFIAILAVLGVGSAVLDKRSAAEGITSFRTPRLKSQC